VKSVRGSVHVDPRDLPEVERSLGLDRDGAGLRRIGVRRIDIAWDALDRLPGIVGDVALPGPIAVLMDAVPMYRGADLLKPAVTRRLAALRDVRVVQVGAPGVELHADLAAIEEARAGAQGAGCVVAVGSGTICDIGKEASRHLGLPYVVVQTANSVNAFGDDMAVLLLHGVKRTVPSRWPDALVVDLGVIADAPPELNQAGVGELTAMFTAPADWRLAKAFGMDDSWDPRPVALFRDGAPALVDAGARLARGDRTALEPLVELMTLSGLALGVAGRTAPISGLEHTVSHLLDMAAAQRGTRTGLHGAQVGVAALVVAVAWRRLLDEVDPERLRDAPPPEPAAIRARIRDAFGALDTTGSIEAECAAAYTRKLERWAVATTSRNEAIAGWDAIRAELRELVGSPESIAAILRGAGAPAAFDELDPSVQRDTGAWAVYNGHLQRDRFSVADLAAATGGWTATFVREVIEEAEGLAGVARARVERAQGGAKPTRTPAPASAGQDGVR
jgi:glycerol-1-phosphate dehydrogenase [NAD(P)+]